MRLVNGTLALILFLFVLFQYNDPDALLWMAIYGVACAWSALAAFRPGFSSAHQGVYWAMIVSIVGYVVWFAFEAPTMTSEFLSQSMMAPNVETTREALGTLICAIATGIALWSERRGSAGLALAR